MKLKKGIIQKKMNDDYYLVDSGISGTRFNGMIKLNETGAFIAKCLEESVTDKDLISQLCRKYNVSEEQASKDIKKMLDSLQNIGIIENE